MGLLSGRLPLWAQRSHPIVRHHLRGQKGVDSIPVRLLLRLYAFQAVLLVLSIPLPVLYNMGSSPPDLLLIVLMAAIFTYAHLMLAVYAVPASLALYGYLLFTVGRAAVRHIFDERQSQTFSLLRTTPLPLREILLGKIAAAIWQQGSKLRLALTVAAIFSLPPIALEYEALYSLEQPTALLRLSMIAGLTATLLRPLLELLMVGAVGLLAGSLASIRTAATLSTAALAGFYFLLLNLPRLAPLSLPLRLLIEDVLPLALPPIIILMALFAAEYTLTRD